MTLALAVVAVVAVCANCAESKHVSADHSGASASAKAGQAPAKATASATAGQAPAKAGQAPAKATAQAGASGKAAAAAVNATGAVNKRETKSYILEVKAPSKLADGHAATAAIQLLPKKGWHVNDQFPIKLSVTAPAGVKLAKAVQHGKDAATFSKAKAAFNVQFTASSPGTKAFSADFKFAVCSPTSCVPQRQKLAWTVAVK